MSNKFNGFENYETDHCVSIIMSSYDLFMERKSFNNVNDFRNYFKNQNSIIDFIDVGKINWQEVFDFFQLNYN